MSCCFSLITSQRTSVNVYDPDIFNCSGHTEVIQREGRGPWEISCSRRRGFLAGIGGETHALEIQQGIGAAEILAQCSRA